jgi:hypothetical protein
MNSAPEEIAMPTAHTSRPSNSTLPAKTRNRLDGAAFAFPAKRKEPLNDASHVRNAVARFDQVNGVSDSEREEAFQNIKAAAKRHGVEMSETSWKQRGAKPRTATSAH